MPGDVPHFWANPTARSITSNSTPNAVWLWQIMVFAMERTVKELGAYPPGMAGIGAHKHPLNFGTGQGMILDPFIDNCFF